jgi:hypothetical protein
VHNAGGLSALEHRMSWFNWFQKRPPIRDAAALAEFIDGNAAFLMQKGIYEYSRARAGHYAKVLLREPEFQAAVEASRWRAFPLGLALVAEMVAGALHGQAGERHATLAALSDIVLDVFDRYPVPAALGDDEWRGLRGQLAHRLQLIGLHPPKRVMDIPEQWAQTYFDLMPIHEKLRVRDFPTTRNYLRVALCNIHDEFVARLDLPAVAASLGRAEVA